MILNKENQVKHTLRFLILSLLVNIVFTSCDKLGLCDDEELSLTRQGFLGNSLRTDGFYYRYADTDFQDVDLYETLILYKNGILSLPGTVEFDELNSYIESLSQTDQSNTKFVWGLFVIEDSNISINHWVAAQCGYPSVLRVGEILNDTTFILKKLTRLDSQGIKESDIEETFHFRQLSTKLDSINNYIK